MGACTSRPLPGCGAARSACPPPGHGGRPPPLPPRVCRGLRGAPERDARRVPAGARARPGVLRCGGPRSPAPRSPVGDGRPGAGSDARLGCGTCKRRGIRRCFWLDRRASPGSLALASCGGDDEALEPTTETTSDRSETTTTTTETTTEHRREPTVVRMPGGQRRSTGGGIVRETVHQDDRVRLVVTSDVADHIHLHGTTSPATSRPGPVRLPFRATFRAVSRRRRARGPGSSSRTSPSSLPPPPAPPGPRLSPSPSLRERGAAPHAPPRSEAESV